MQIIYNILYYILIFILAFIISLILIPYFSKQTSLSIILSIIVAITTDIIIYFVNKYKKQKNLITKSQQENKNKLLNHLLYSSKLENLKFLKLIKPNCYIDYKNKILKEKNNSNIYIPYYNKNTISNDDIIKIIKDYSNKNILNICCIESTIENLDIYLDNNCINIITLDDIIKKQNNEIKEYILKIKDINKNKKASKLTLAQIKSNILDSSKWKQYFLYGLTLIYFSLFNKQKIYFRIFACIFFVLSILCLCKKLIKKLC